jgi:hypothetical protein
MESVNSHTKSGGTYTSSKADLDLFISTLSEADLIRYNSRDFDSSVYQTAYTSETESTAKEGYYTLTDSGHIRFNYKLSEADQIRYDYLVSQSSKKHTADDPCQTSGKDEFTHFEEDLSLFMSTLSEADQIRFNYRLKQLSKKI